MAMASRTRTKRRTSTINHQKKKRTASAKLSSGLDQHLQGKLVNDPVTVIPNKSEDEILPKPVEKQPAQITLRPISPSDQVWIMQVTKEEMGPIFLESYGYELNLDNVMQYVHSAQTRMILVNDQLAGYVSVVVDESGKMNIGSLVLTGSHKRQGYGTRIMKLLEQEARSMGLIELEAFVQSSNQASLHFLQKLGFQEVPSMQSQTKVLIKNIQTS